MLVNIVKNLCRRRSRFQETEGDDFQNQIFTLKFINLSTFTIERLWTGSVTPLQPSK